MVTIFQHKGRERCCKFSLFFSIDSKTLQIHEYLFKNKWQSYTCLTCSQVNNIQENDKKEISLIKYIYRKTTFHQSVCKKMTKKKISLKCVENFNMQRKPQVLNIKKFYLVYIYIYIYISGFSGKNFNLNMAIL